MEQDTKKNIALLANRRSSNPYSQVQNKQKNHTHRSWKGCSGQDSCSMNEAFHMHIRLILVYEKAFHKWIRPDFIKQLGLWIKIVDGHYFDNLNCLISLWNVVYWQLITTQTLCKT